MTLGSGQGGPFLTASLGVKKVPDAIIRRKGRTNASMLHALIGYALYSDGSMVMRLVGLHSLLWPLGCATDHLVRVADFRATLKICTSPSAKQM
jgi:hypothetical protein